MTKIAWSAIFGIALIASLFLLSAPAEAQAMRTWVTRDSPEVLTF
jgi:hypothetical protein